MILRARRIEKKCHNDEGPRKKQKLIVDTLSGRRFCFDVVLKFLSLNVCARSHAALFIIFIPIFK